MVPESEVKVVADGVGLEEVVDGGPVVVGLKRCQSSDRCRQI